MTSTALIVVDVQKDFCPGGSLAVPHGDEVVPIINKLLLNPKLRDYGYWDIIVLTRDWHPANSEHFKEHGGVWPVHCVAGTSGSEFHPKLVIPANAVMILKGTAAEGESREVDGYSGFDGKDSSGKPLLDVLREAGIEKVEVAGLATDYCVKATVLDALRYGFDTYLYIDACRGVDLSPGDSRRAVDEMLEAGASLITTAPDYKFDV